MWINEFVSVLKKSTVEKPRIDDALNLKEAHLPSRLYKHCRVNSDSLNSLRDEAVWICSPEKYNDPYDCLFRITEADVISAAKQGLVTEFVRVFKLKRFLSPDVIKSARASDDPLQQLVNAIPPGQVFQPGSDPVRMAQFASIKLPAIVGNTIEFIRQIRDATKVCSFTERNDSILMWSHYSDYHKGFCIEYDFGKLPPQHQLRRNVFPVIYSASLLDLTQWSKRLVSVGRKRFNPTMTLFAMMHKHKDWRYEHEWRFILIEPKLTNDRAMKVPTPSREFLGSRMSPEVRTELLGICAAKGIEVWQMEKVPDAFELKSVRVA
jgi:hypothetical protein